MMTETDRPELQIPKWNHPRYGELTPVPRPPRDEPEEYFYSLLVPLINRKWRLANMTLPYPEINYVSLEDPVSLSQGFSGFAGVLIQSKHNPDWNWLSHILEINQTELFVPNEPTGIAIACPFCNWDLYEFWEQGLYDK